MRWYLFINLKLLFHSFVIQVHQVSKWSVKIKHQNRASKSNIKIKHQNQASKAFGAPPLLTIMQLSYFAWPTPPSLNKRNMWMIPYVTKMNYIWLNVFILIAAATQIIRSLVHGAEVGLHCKLLSPRIPALFQTWSDKCFGKRKRYLPL